MTARIPAAAVFPWWRLLLWSVRRELWENRMLLLLPAIGAFLAPCLLVLTLIAFGHSLHVSDQGWSELTGASAVRRAAALYSLAGLAEPAAVFAALLYALGALNGEARDRSILFWKSLPVSDSVAVAAKVITAAVVTPVVACVWMVVVVFVMLGVWLILSPHSAPVATTLSGVPVLGWLVLGNFLWGLPVFAYLMLVSVLARRSPIGWAVGIVALVVIVEYGLRGSWVAALTMLRLLGHLVRGFPSTVDFSATASGQGMSGASGTHLDLSAMPGSLIMGGDNFWLGLVAAGVMLAATIFFRRRQTAR